LSYKYPEENLTNNSNNLNGNGNGNANANAIKIEIKERPMLFDNNAFKKRPNTSKSFSENSLKPNYNKDKDKDKDNISKNKKEIKEKIFRTTKEDPFLHKNFTEIPD
jgi:hypothetical protein